MYNLRYHIASLLAVFLALSVGLVLGTIVVERGVLDKQKKTLVQSLTEDFTDITAENKTLRAETDAGKAFAEAAVGRLVSGSLEGSTVVLVTDAGRTDALAAAQEAVKAAGGIPAVVTLRKEHAGLNETATADRVRSLTRSRDVTSVAELEERAATAVAIEWANDGRRPVTDALAEMGAITVEGLPSGVQVRGLVLLASTETTVDPVALSLAVHAAQRGIRAVGGEVTGLETQAADAAVLSGLPAVDHLDLPEGRLSLVWALAEGVKGHYGIDKGAVARFPDLSR